MKFRNMARAALTLALGVMTTTVLALDYKESFEDDSVGWTVNEPGTMTNAVNWYAGPNDQSYVTNGVTYVLDGGISGPISGISGANTHALRLNTEGDTLTNKFSTVETTFESDPIWLDTVVQFVLSEDLPTGLADDVDVKMALYALAGETSTNLVVHHAIYDEGFLATNTVTDIEIDPEAWYRVTVKMAAGETMHEIPQAFSIMVNGQLVEVTENAYGADWLDTFEMTPAGAGSWFLSAGTEGSYPSAIESLAFQGTGFIDDLCLVDTDPFAIPPSGEGFLITQNVGANGAANPAGEIQIADGGTTSIVYTADDWYRIQELKVDDVAVTEAAGLRSFEWTLVDADANHTVDVSFGQTTSYGEESLSGDVVNWLVTEGYDEDDVNGLIPLATAYLLDADPTTTTSYSFTVDSIVVDSDVKVAVKLLVNDAPHQGINGALVLYGRASLTEGDWVATGQMEIPGASVFDVNGVKEFTFTDADPDKFYKAVIETYEDVP